MSYRTFVVVTMIVILGLVGIMSHLYYDRVVTDANMWGGAIQEEEEALRRVNALESLLEKGQLDAVALELRRHRERSLTGLATMMAIQFKPDSPNMIFARRVFCAEMPVVLLEPRNGGEETGTRIIKDTEPHCENERGKLL